MNPLRFDLLYNYSKRIRNKLFTWLLTPALHSIGNRTSIIPPFRFGNLNRIKIGSRVTIHDDCWIQVLSQGKKYPGPNIIINDYAGIGMNSTISAVKKVTIGKYAFTARNVFISDHLHEFSDINTPIALQGLGRIKEVHIGDYSWLGHNAVVLPGVTIGKHCVVGANAVVTHSIPDYSVVAGAPGRIIRRYDSKMKRWIQN